MNSTSAMPDPADAREGAQDLLAQIEELTGDRRYSWALDTLEGIYETVERTGRATEGQRQAVQNIEEGLER